MDGAVSAQRRLRVHHAIAFLNVLNRAAHFADDAGRLCAQPARHRRRRIKAAANIGIAMGGGTDVALETADAAILHGRVMDIFNMVSLSNSVMNNIWQNISISIGLKIVFFITTILGITGLWPAILADTGATVLVTANAMRLLRWKAKRVFLSAR